MPRLTKRLGLTQPAIYVISVQGEPGTDWEDWFGDMNIAVEEGVITIIGTIADQPALHGLLRRIRDLRLPLLSVEHVRSVNCAPAWSRDQVKE